MPSKNEHCVLSVTHFGLDSMLALFEISEKSLRTHIYFINILVQSVSYKLKFIEILVKTIL